MSEVFAPTGKLDLAAVSEFHAALLERRGQDTRVDMSGVSHIGALCLQCLIAAAIDAVASGARFQLADVPDHVQAQLANLGFSANSLLETPHDA